MACRKVTERNTTYAWHNYDQMIAFSVFMRRGVAFMISSEYNLLIHVMKMLTLPMVLSHFYSQINHMIYRNLTGSYDLSEGTRAEMMKIQK